MDNNKFIEMARREEEVQKPRFHRYLYSQSPEGSHPRRQIIPNRILLSDHATPVAVPAASRLKQRKLPFFASKAAPKGHLGEGNIFTKRGIVGAGGLEAEGRLSLSRLALQPQRRKTESSLSLFNKLILTPFNFVRPNNALASSASLRERRALLLSAQNKPASADRAARSRPPPRHRTLEDWSRGRRGERVKPEPREPLVGWETACVDGEDFLS